MEMIAAWFADALAVALGALFLLGAILAVIGWLRPPPPSDDDCCGDAMTAPVRVQLSRAKGWRMPPNTVKVDRATPWGNGLIMAHEGTRTLAIAQHAQQSRAQAEALPSYFEPLHGKNLACWCLLDRPCHADVLLELANAPEVPCSDP